MYIWMIYAYSVYTFLYTFCCSEWTSIVRNSKIATSWSIWRVNFCIFPPSSLHYSKGILIYLSDSTTNRWRVLWDESVTVSSHISPLEMFLGLVSTQPIVDIQQSCWLFFWNVTAVIVIIDLERNIMRNLGSICTIIEYSSKCLLPTFASK